MAKQLLPEQCEFLHQRYPPPDCCICALRADNAALLERIERLEGAGDAMALALDWLLNGFPDEEQEDAMKAAQCLEQWQTVRHGAVLTEEKNDGPTLCATCGCVLGSNSECSTCMGAGR